MKLLSHIRANAIAYLALFVALGGTSAWAASQIGSNDIKDESIKSRDVANDSLTGDDIDEATLQAQASGDGPAFASGRVAVTDSDPDTGGGDKVTLLETPSHFVIQGVCDRTAEGVTAQVRASASLGATAISSDGLNTTNVQNGTPTLMEVSSSAAAQEENAFSIVEPNGRAIQGIANASVNAQGKDCIFAVSLFEQLSN